MTKIVSGAKIPDLTLPATGGQEIRLSALKGRHVVLYFYPKDSTPGCTTEGQDFRDLYDQFRKAGAEVFGISRDSLKSHENFKAKQNFPFELLSDSDEKACKLFDVLKEKNMYGRITLGVERSTFLFDSKGVLRREWRKVKVAGHAAQVLDAVRELNA
jgi:peroxiredoxin Q/BCP